MELDDFVKSESDSSQKFQVYTEKNLMKIPQLAKLDKDILNAMNVVAHVLPFRVNNYVIEWLIDWDNIPNDPMFQLTFPQAGMLHEEDFLLMSDLLRKKSATQTEIKLLANEIRRKLNPQPAEQKTLNVPSMDGIQLNGMQHKYKETVLYFPSQGQTCHTYCSFCFRWAQFIGDKELQFSASSPLVLLNYLREHRKVTDVLLTGGDPLVAKTKYITACLEPLLDNAFKHIKNIRIGTKAITYWPHRFIYGQEADDLLHLFEKLVKKGKHLTIMAHYNHGVELEPMLSKLAIKRILATGAIIRSQGPLIRHVNDNAKIWVDLWNKQVELGIIPYYMFVERDTGANRYFELSLEQAWHIFRDAISNVSGLARTARGPSMSASPGKVEIQGVTEIAGEKVFVLRFIQARNANWCYKPFFAKFDATATWFSQLKPAFGEDKFFFE